MKRSDLARATKIVDRLGIALVYPLGGKTELPSLWGALHPKVKMEWSWNADADPRVAEVWHLREQLARTHDVAYAKWFRGRATFFSLPVFHAILGRIAASGNPLAGLSREAIQILELLRERSPLSTKEIRQLADLRGKEQEAIFTRAMKALWTRLLVVGVGEVEDGAFPSLAVGATELLFEDLWSARQSVPPDAERKLNAALAQTPAFERELRRSLDEVRKARTVVPKKEPKHAPMAKSKTRKKKSSGSPKRAGKETPFSEPTAVEVLEHVREDR